MKNRNYKGIKAIAYASQYCSKGLYYCLAYDQKQDILITEEFAGNPSQGWVEWAQGYINIGVIDHKMTMKEIRAMCEETLREIGRE